MTIHSLKKIPYLETNQAIKIGWNAPANIALVKYWGKHGKQLPDNASLSITLDQTSTTTFLTLQEKSRASEGISLEYNFHGEKQEKFEHKTAEFLASLLPEMPFLGDYRLVFDSTNHFPHSAGIASSASSMAALALCLVSMEELVSGKAASQAAFFRRASYLARLGSGSASRSIYGGLVSWGNSPFLSQSTNEFATRFPLHEGSRLNSIRDIILVISSSEKKISSREGHQLMKAHPYREGRKIQATNNLKALTAAIRSDNYQGIAAISENEALSLHALLISSQTDGILLQPETLHLIREIRQFRQSSGLDLFFTIDAGPNVHLIHYEDQREQVLSFVRDKLQPYCDKGLYLDDKIGEGPKLVTDQFVE